MAPAAVAGGSDGCSLESVDLGAILGWVTAGLIAVGVLLWRLVGTGADKQQAQVDEVMAELNRQSVLGRELEKTRGTERQELRFEATRQIIIEREC